MTSPAGIVAFDLDGTLLPNTTVCLHLGPWVGHHDIGELEGLYDLGQMTNIEVAERDAAFYKNRRRHDVWHQLEQLELIDGLEDTITWLKSRSLRGRDLRDDPSREPSLAERMPEAGL